jgi:5-methylcytosine-specific restriction endonuclease McrA
MEKLITIQKRVSHWKGKKFPEDMRRRMSQAHLGYKHSEETKLKMSLVKKGTSIKPHSEEHKKRISFSLHGRNIGERGSNWKGGKTNFGKILRDRFEYKEWRNKVYIRDNYTCQICNKVGGKLHAHHIKSFAFYPDLRYDINNGITLCLECHKKTDSYLKNKLKGG